jgi:hypothetical protein
MTACPCCEQSVAAPSLDSAIASHRLDGFEASILRAVWRGKGHPVPTERIFDAMYVDDPDGGPLPTRMYAEFNKALCRLNSQLSSAGIAILSVGYRKGYRLALGGNGG